MTRQNLDIPGGAFPQHAYGGYLYLFCNRGYAFPLAGQLAAATVRRIDETHANPLAAWIAMGAPDYVCCALTLSKGHPL